MVYPINKHNKDFIKYSKHKSLHFFGITQQNIQWKQKHEETKEPEPEPEPLT